MAAPRKKCLAGRPDALAPDGTLGGRDRDRERERRKIARLVEELVRERFRERFL